MNAEKAVDALQSVLRGEHMAIGVYGAVLDTMPDSAVKELLLVIRDSHKRHAEQLAQRISALGSEPVQNTGMSGWMARASIRMKGWFRQDPRAVLRQLYDGEDQGIAAAESITKDKLDSESRALVASILAEDRRHLGQLEELIAQQTGDLRI